MGVEGGSGISSSSGCLVKALTCRTPVLSPLFRYVTTDVFDALSSGHVKTTGETVNDGDAKYERIEGIEPAREIAIFGESTAGDAAERLSDYLRFGRFTCNLLKRQRA